MSADQGRLTKGCEAASRSRPREAPREWTVFACVVCGAIDDPPDCPAGCGHCDGVVVVPKTALEAAEARYADLSQAFDSTGGDWRNTAKRLVGLEAALEIILDLYERRVAEAARYVGIARAALDMEQVHGN